MGYFKSQGRGERGMKAFYVYWQYDQYGEVHSQIITCNSKAQAIRLVKKAHSNAYAVKVQELEKL